MWNLHTSRYAIFLSFFNTCHKQTYQQKSSLFKKKRKHFSLKASREWLYLQAWQEKHSNFLFDLTTLPGSTGVIFSHLNTVITFVNHTILYQTMDKILPFFISTAWIYIFYLDSHLILTAKGRRNEFLSWWQRYSRHETEQW